MRYSLLFVIMCFLTVSFTALGQEKKLEKANEKFEQLSYIDAQKAYLEVAQQGYRSEDLLKRLGDSFYFTADYVNAAHWYGALYEYSDAIDPEYLYRYALSLKSSGDYQASDELMEELFKMEGRDYRAMKFSNERDYLNEIDLQSGRFEIENAPFNSSLSDFAPAFKLGEIVFASNKVVGRSTRLIHDWNEQPFLDLYTVSQNNDPDELATRLSNDVNTKYHESTAVFTKDGTTMYFTRNNYTNKKYKNDTNGTNRLKLYKATSTGQNDWKVEELPFNSDEYSVAHPALSSDEKTLYFASDMPGGRGMSDLYKVDLSGGAYGTPENLGEEINTEGRETFPFVSSNNNFYFASDGHVGLGGLDIFVSKMDGENFGEIFNVGRPINGEDDDFTFIINGKTGKGYFASNRDGGKGDDDIYSFNRTRESILSSCAQKLEGVVLDDVTNLPIGNAQITFLDNDGNVIEETVSQADGVFEFPMECNTQYSVRGKKITYGTAEKSIIVGNQAGNVMRRTLYLRKGVDLTDPVALTPGSDLGKLLQINPIYFDLDKSFIRTDAAIELSKVISVMKQYPALKIDVRSHTDSRAPDDYNMALSQRRNVSTIDFIVQQGGIDRSRLSGRGYGETQLTNGCVNGAKCSEGAHQLNRRSEFIILE